LHRLLFTNSQVIQGQTCHTLNAFLPEKPSSKAVDHSCHPAFFPKDRRSHTMPNHDWSSNQPARPMNRPRNLQNLASSTIHDWQDRSGNAGWMIPVLIPFAKEPPQADAMIHMSTSLLLSAHHNATLTFLTIHGPVRCVCATHRACIRRNMLPRIVDVA
jgi:hypothetical protein